MYQALYRKYRPQTFDDVVGQQAVTQTLKNQIVTGKLSHAYLLTGTRGTGKTTCSKVLAKAVNCLNLTDKTVRPMARLHTLLRMDLTSVTRAASSETATSRHTRRSA